MKAVLAVAGLDSSGGAGLAADAATIAALGCHPKVAATAITAQSLSGIDAISLVAPELVEQQIEAAFQDLAPSAVKVGMLGTDGIADGVAHALDAVGARNIVVDPVLRSTSGTALFDAGRQMLPQALAELLRRASLATPNVPEAEALLGHAIETPAALEKAAGELAALFGCPVLLKGGHLGLARDVLAGAAGGGWIGVEAAFGPSPHGTGCALSSAIAAGLAQGFDLASAIQRAKEFLAARIAGSCILPEGAYLPPAESIWSLRQQRDGRWQ